MFHEMDDWCMAKDYSGAERFEDGSRPLLAETAFADITISGVPGESVVSIGVYPHGEIWGYFYEGKTATKELAIKIGADISQYIGARDDGPFMFINGDFDNFFKSQPISDIRTHEFETENTIPDFFEDDSELDQGEEI